jgi:hypothetical protein
MTHSDDLDIPLELPLEAVDAEVNQKKVRQARKKSEPLSMMEQMQALADATNARWVDFYRSQKDSTQAIVTNGMDLLVQEPRKVSKPKQPVYQTLAHPVDAKQRELKIHVQRVNKDIRTQFNMIGSPQQSSLNLQYELHNRRQDRKMRWASQLGVPKVPPKPVPIITNQFAKVAPQHHELDGASFYKGE